MEKETTIQLDDGRDGALSDRDNSDAMTWDELK
jgi:hypothetical protein